MTLMPVTQASQPETRLDVSPDMLSGSLDFFASPPGVTFATPLPYGVTNNLNDYGWIWQDGSFLTVEFPLPVAMTRIRVYCVYNGGERGAQWIIAHSGDNSSWLHAADFTYWERFGAGVDDAGSPMTGTGGWYSVAFNEEGIPDQYWRIRQTATLDDHAPRSGEMEFYGIAEPPSDTAPRLTVQPASQTVLSGTSVVFKVVAWGTPPLTYQWRFNERPLTLVTTNLLTLSDVQQADAGDYDVVVANNYGSVTSRVAMLNIHATLYVSLDSTNPIPPFASWATAATNIQNAVDAAKAGDTVLVTNGVYATGGRAVGTNLLTNRVAVDKPITLRSVNGPQFTIIQGAKAPGGGSGDGAIRCVYLADGASLSGFKLTNGATRTWDVTEDEREVDGGGVWCASTNAALTNCVMVGNSACYAGGGAYSGTLYNCTLTGNSAEFGGGAGGGTLYNCTLTGNSAGIGGGARECTLYNCTLTDNSAD